MKNNMRIGYKNRAVHMRWRATAFVLCLLCVCLFCLPAFAMANTPQKVIRVGFFDFEGYHELDDQNRRSGYGYEYLHEMAKYTGWVFEYVDCTWEECQSLLESGKIDLLTSAQYTEQRGKQFDFSSSSMGTSYAQLTVMDGNDTYGRNDFEDFDGIKIGLLAGNSRNSRLAEFAAERDFSYTWGLYNTQDQLDNALRTGAVDAVLTSSLRKTKNERIIAQFGSAPFYAIVQKGNTELLDEVNFALESIEMNSPAFRYNLYQKHYRANTTDTFVLSKAETAYLNTNPTIRAVIRPGVYPISYWEEDLFQGITADVMSYLLEGLNIQVEYVHPENLKASYQLLADGEADIACLFESDYNLAEQYRTRITTPYFKANYSVIFRTPLEQSAQFVQTIAAPEGSPICVRYANKHYPNAKLLFVDSNDTAIKAVSKGKADLAFVNVYSAEKAIASYPELHVRFISDDEQQFSVGVSQTANPELFSILDKKINAMDSQLFNDILSRHTMFNQEKPSLESYFKQNPLQIILGFASVFALLAGILFYIVFINKKHSKNIYDLAYIDPLTKLYNLNGFLLYSNKLLEKQPDALFSVITLDLSKFSSVNENYGRGTGDKVIKEVGGILEYFFAAQGIVAHVDADRFLMMLSYTTQEVLHASLLAIREMFSACTIDDLALRFQAYIGVSMVERSEDSILHAIDHARTARSKCNSEHPIAYMDEALKSSLMREKEIQENLEQALEDGEFEVYYQPKFDMASGKMIGAEALVRWNHHNLGFLSPAEFIPVLEQDGVITEVDFYVLEQTCKLLRKWMDAGQMPVVVSVNQSRAHFYKKDYLERLQNVLTRYAIPPRHIELEITETLFGQEAISEEIITKMKAMGLLTSIDDFGSGYSSLYLLHQISVDVLKIDKGLLDEGGRHEKVRNIIRRIVQIAADLNVDVICEGVETREQVNFLLEIGCKYAQGFFYSKPLPQQQFEELVAHSALLEIRSV